VVHLAWNASTDPYSDNPVLTYEVDRSVDQSNWAPIASGISPTSFDDTTAAFSVHYYYRVNASDDGGQTSGYSTADVTTPGFTSNVDSGGTTFKSEDGLASVVAPAGAIPTEYNCTVASNTQVLRTTGSQKVVAGPYQLVCKNANGDLLASFGASVKWTINLKGKLSGVGTPVFSTVEVNGALTALKSAEYDKTAQTIAGETSSTQSVAVTAPKQAGFPWSILAAVLFIGGVIMAVIVLVALRRRNLSYRDYLRRKYYEI
jgi:hypothetical protein